MSSATPPIGPTQHDTVDVKDPKALQLVFTETRLRATIKRMKAWQETENEVSHPLRALILVEFEDALVKSLASAVPAGSWSPSPAYVVLVAKRSGTYRELAFPGLIDTIVGRRIIDSLEPSITKDDNDRVFFGRSHANADRRRGDYESWFKVWLDYSARIDHALKKGGYTYVFDTDITQFFPTVDRDRAKRSLAQRTSAHQTLLELLFYCIESWAPRIRYCAVPGLPIEPNDVSRLVAHNFIKTVDEHFVHNSDIHYLRWVDDTVVFAANERAAHDIKRIHHLALREVGLSPNASKTTIQTAEEYAASRHPEFNRKISDAQTTSEIAELARSWFARAPDQTPNWDKVGTRLYSQARRLKSDSLRQTATDHIIGYPTLMKAALKYLASYPLPHSDLARLIAHYNQYTTSAETRIELARFLCDTRLENSAESAPALLNLSVGQVLADDIRPGTGYARSLLLLVLNKYGGKAERDKVRQALTIDRLQDDQLRLHFLYVFKCRRELDDSLANAARHLDTSDISLMMRLCEDALAARLKQHEVLLKKCISAKHGVRTIEARHLPIVTALLAAKEKRETNLRWLKDALEGPKSKLWEDAAVKGFLHDELRIASR